MHADLPIHTTVRADDTIPRQIQPLSGLVLAMAIIHRSILPTLIYAFIGLYNGNAQVHDVSPVGITGKAGLGTVPCHTDTVTGLFWYEYSTNLCYLVDMTLKPLYFILGDGAPSMNVYSRGVFYYPMMSPSTMYYDIEKALNSCQIEIPDFPAALNLEKYKKISVLLDTLRSSIYGVSAYIHTPDSILYEHYEYKHLKLTMVVTFVGESTIKLRDINDVYITESEPGDGFIVRQVPFFYVHSILDVHSVP